MKKLFLLLTIISGFAFKSSAQQIHSYNADQLMERITNKDTLYIVNFWATWCAPCVKELPCFDTLQQIYTGKPVKVLLLSFDFKEGYPDKLRAFINKKKTQPEVAWFTGTDANEFIPKIDTAWSGSLPGTLIIQQGQSFKQLLENTITTEKVRAIVDKQITL